MQSPETEERWYVNVGGTPKVMNLDEIVEAFEAGTINGKTLVTEVGGSEWKPLKEVADLGDDEQPGVEAPAAAAAVEAPRASVVLPPVGQPQAKPSVPPSIRATQSGWPPVVASRPPASMAPAAAHSVAPSGAAPSMPPLSTMPVVQDIGLDLDAEFKPRKSRAPIYAGAVVVAFIGGLFGVGRLTGGGEIVKPIPVPAAAPVALATATSNTVETPTPTPAAAPAPTTTTTSDSASGDKPSTDKPSDSGSADSRLADDVKAKLKDADKSHADKKKAAKAARGHVASRSKGSSSSGVFRAGGNANDPLNSKL